MTNGEDERGKRLVISLQKDFPIEVKNLTIQPLQEIKKIYIYEKLADSLEAFETCEYKKKQHVL